MNDWSYNLLVGFPFILFFSVLVGMWLQKPSSPRSIDKFSKIWVFGLLFLLGSSILKSQYSLSDSILAVTLQFFPVFILFCGERIASVSFSRFINMWIVTAPVHAIYEIYQFFFGPFGFETQFIGTKNSVVGAVEGNFYRGIPLYDNAEVLYVHFALVVAFIWLHRRNVRGYFLIVLILVATLLMGNRGGVIEVLIAISFAVVLGSNYPAKKVVVVGLLLLGLLSLSIFGVVAMQYVTELPEMNLGNSSFAERLGALGTIGDRIIGRENAAENLTLFGMGFGTSGLSMSVLSNKGLNFELMNHSIYAHDIIGELILDLGIVGALLFVFLFFKVLSNALTFNALSSIGGAVLASFFVSSLLGSSYTLGRAGFLVFFLAGHVLSKGENALRV